ncbi:actin-domain-containing protein [Lactarius quietus]|nr:actin-domain-containing protein [Lactarius quietus]
MSALAGPSTPRTRTSHVTLASATPAAVTSAARTAHSGMVQASPHYQTTRRHSLYGTEDRIVIDPGSRVWKVGFSGEGHPRDVFFVHPLWSLHRSPDPIQRDEDDRVLAARVQAHLRAVFHDSLLTDPKSRKVIIIEHPLLPVYVKDIFAKILFENLQVPSISFASSHLLALLSAGRITGLVLDCGELESTALPIFSSRPLFHQLRTTPLAGARLTSHIRALLLLFGTYVAPPTSLSAAVNVPPASSRSTRVPLEVLSDAVLEEIKTRCSFVGETLDTALDPGIVSPLDEDPMDVDLPPSESAPSESELSRVSADSGDNADPTSSGLPEVSRSHVLPERSSRDEHQLQVLADLYIRHSTATDLRLKVTPPASQQTGTGQGTLIIPGWIRERGSELLFEGGDVDESSIAEVVLDCLLKIPVDLRKTLASSILVTGGTAMLPGFIPRLHVELIRAIVTSPSSSPRPPLPPGRARPPPYDRYAVLRPLVPHFAILNNPSPPPSDARRSANAGKAPAFTPATMAWVGGSLAGALKTGGVEVPREKWDEAGDIPDPGDVMEEGDVAVRSPAANVIPDWTRTSLPVGAPPANPPPQMHETTPLAVVGA